MSMNPTEPPDIKQVLGVEKAAKGRKTLWFAVGSSVCLLILATGVALYFRGGATQYETTEAVRGDFDVTVTATGTLEPTNQVDVGCEISGAVETVEVDFNDRVSVGDVLARLDTDRLEARLVEARYVVQSAEARVREAEATVGELLARLERCQALLEDALCSQEEYDAVHASFIRAETQVDSAKAVLSQNRATLEVAETDLSKAVIRSPIDGIVLVRSVEPGQTVAASLQAPVLFTLAENLSQMELHVDVDEADIGQIKEGQRAKFTVDAYPDREFYASIREVRFAPQTVERVVTYESVLAVDNSDLALRPGMTATADITVNHIENALLVPNAALRFAPPDALAPDGPGGSRLVDALLPGPPRRGPRGGPGPVAADPRRQRVWTLDNGGLTPIPVVTGATDGIMTELVEAPFDAGYPVVLRTVVEAR